MPLDYKDLGAGGTERRIQKLKEQHELALLGGGAEAIDRQHERMYSIEPAGSCASGGNVDGSRVKVINRKSRRFSASSPIRNRQRRVFLSPHTGQSHAPQKRRR